MIPFTPSNSALLLIDHQVGTMQLIKNLHLDFAKAMAVSLAKAAQILGMPVILTSSQEDQAQGPLIPEMKAILPEAFEARIRRPGIVNAWAMPAFKQAVEATGRRNLIMAGVTTDVCLIYPAISAAEEGYQVQAVMDASGSPTDQSELFAQQRMRAAGVTLTATNTLIAELAQDWSTPHGQQLIQLLFTDVFPAMKVGISPMPQAA